MAERKEARRRKLLSEAIRLFGEHGFHATTVPMIVAAADSSTGTFYLYFRNKEDVFAAALEWLDEHITAAINQAMAGAGPDVLAHMKAAVVGLVRFLAEHPEEARILIVESSGLGQRLEAVRRAVIRSHTRGVQQALAVLGTRLPPMDTQVVANCWVGAVYEAVFQWLDRPADQRLEPEQLAEAIAGFNLRAIGAVGGELR
jgi:AcrR family transcriptional regulator